jgi:NitT/TauT family transport system ATP-binding protein
MIQTPTEVPNGTKHVILEARNVSKTFQNVGGETVALRNLSLSLKSGEIIGIVGPTGCGKTTAMRLLAQLEKPTSGLISLFPVPGKIDGRPSCSFVFQKTLLFPWRTTSENILLPYELVGKLNGEIKEQCRNMIEAVGLKGFENAYPSQLSGGMAQRASVARALISNPDIVFADEPLSAADEITRERLWVDFRRLWRQRGVSALLVTHSIREAVFFSNRTLVMTPRPGSIAAEINIDLPSDRSAETLYRSEFAAICETVREALIRGTQNHEAK